MLALWPVATVVLSEKGAFEDSGWYEYMFKCWSSEPEAKRRPERDQLRQR